jgi:hypothetical protein
MAKNTANMTQAQREAHWQAESDAHALKRYAEIQGDEVRLKAANEILQEEQAQIQAALISQNMNAILRANTNKTQKE